MARVAGPEVPAAKEIGLEPSGLEMGWVAQTLCLKSNTG